MKEGDTHLIKLTSPICVQDPFELNHCVSGGFSKVGKLNWRNSCLAAMEELQNEHFDKAGLQQIFHRKISPPKNKAEQKKIVKRIQDFGKKQKQSCNDDKLCT